MTIIWCMVSEIWIAPDQMFLSYWAIFCPFMPPSTPLPNSPKNEKFKKMKKTLKKSSFNRSVPTIMIICYTVPDIMLHGRCNSYFLFWAIFFHFYPHNSLKNENLKQMNKTPWRYHHFTQLYQKSWSCAIMFLRYGMWQI